jgi:hypothetical protein
VNFLGLLSISFQLTSNGYNVLHEKPPLIEMDLHVPVNSKIRSLHLLDLSLKTNAACQTTRSYRMKFDYNQVDFLGGMVKVLNGWRSGANKNERAVDWFRW